MYLKRSEVNVGTIELGKAIIPTIIIMVKGMSGTGMQKHFMPTKGQISGRCPGKL
jgi:hypothetical protein